MQREFEADGWAFAVGLRAATESESKIASLLGAWFFLAVADRLEQLRGSETLSVHPPAAERMKKLFSFVDCTDLLDRDTRARGRTCLSSLADSVTWIRNDVSTFQASLSKSNTLELFLNWCVLRNEPNRVKDQPPMWILQSAPQRLCDSLAVPRLHAAEDFALHPLGAAAQMQLGLLDWVFEGAIQVDRKG
jgi:hypothetical protein